MSMLSAEKILGIWDRAADQRPIDRALTMLAQSDSALRRSELAALPLGQRDELLLRLREQTFGPRLHTFASCPSCQSALEFDLTVEQLCSARDPAVTQTATEELRWEDYQITFRLPNSQDLLTIESLAATHAAQAVTQLLTRCVLSVTRSGAVVSAFQLPSQLVEALAAHMTARDPLSEILIDLCCPDCSHSWQVAFDIASYLWIEIDVQARRLLSEVYTLARAVGWTESTILALSPRRRQAYLQMVGA